ncbi:hypothetical protein [Streptomyces sp. NPDC046821]|uniref:hypothetical protein n=1 Tax=Streptomyces sp. NPDC046821 TaxID=3154702 RepID=UPI0033E7FC9E
MIEGSIAGVVVIVAVTALAMIGDRASKQKRDKAFAERYGSYEGFRRQVDQARIQETLRAHGMVAAVKAVRDTNPHVSLVLAKRYVDELPA